MLSFADAARLFADPLPWAAVAAAYLLGAVPFGLILARLIRGVDLRVIGSGNIGATNAMRAMGRPWGFAVFTLDFLKGFLPVLLVPFLPGIEPEDAELLRVLVGGAAVLGHCYPLYLGFQGGKGVATGCAAVIALDWRVFLCGGVIWLITRAVTGYAGLASILMGLTFPIAVATWHHMERREFLVGTSLLALLIIVRHRANIHRMLSGTEPNAHSKRKPADEPPHAARPHG